MQLSLRQSFSQVLENIVGWLRGLNGGGPTGAEGCSQLSTTHQLNDTFCTGICHGTSTQILHRLSTKLSKTLPERSPSLQEKFNSHDAIRLLLQSRRRPTPDHVISDRLLDGVCSPTGTCWKASGPFTTFFWLLRDTRRRRRRWSVPRVC
uniref:(northern house mosquito) hypothetical protein n=1 Tax=Culex pipiens TaxID=7175 RepID=A0A8D8C0C1_CULPI